MTNEQLYQTNRQLNAKVTKRNEQIRHMRESLRDLSHILDDSRVQPPLPKWAVKWMGREIKNLGRRIK